MRRFHATFNTKLPRAPRLTLSYRIAFWINLPLSAVCITVIFFLLPLKPVTGSWKV